MTKKIVPVGKGQSNEINQKTWSKLDVGRQNIMQMKVKLVCSECNKKIRIPVNGLKEAHKFKRMYKGSKFTCTDCAKPIHQLQIGIFETQQTSKRQDRKRSKTFSFATDLHYGMPAAKSLTSQLFDGPTQKTLKFLADKVEPFNTHLIKTDAVYKVQAARARVVK